MKAKLIEVPFVSQLRRGQQSKDFGCGVASLMMLLKYHDEPVNSISYKNLANELRAYDSPQEKGLRDRRGCGVYRRDVEKWLRSKDISYEKWVRNRRKDCKGPFDSPRMLPIMVEMAGERWGDFGHWIVCVRATAHQVNYLDPSFGTGKVHSIRRSEFSKDWFGNAIGIVPKMKSKQRTKIQ